MEPDKYAQLKLLYETKIEENRKLEAEVNRLTEDLKAANAAIPIAKEQNELEIEALMSDKPPSDKDEVLVEPKDDDNAEEALDETDVLCTRCKMMVNQNHKKLCSEFFNLVIKNARGETKCYFCEMKFKFRNKAYQHIKLNHFSKKVVISCKKLSNETIDEYKKKPIENIHHQLVKRLFNCHLK